MTMMRYFWGAGRHKKKKNNMSFHFKNNLNVALFIVRRSGRTMLHDGLLAGQNISLRDIRQEMVEAAVRWWWRTSCVAACVPGTRLFHVPGAGLAFISLLLQPILSPLPLTRTSQLGVKMDYAIAWPTEQASSCHRGFFWPVKKANRFSIFSNTCRVSFLVMVCTMKRTRTLRSLLSGKY